MTAQAHWTEETKDIENNYTPLPEHQIIFNNMVKAAGPVANSLTFEVDWDNSTANAYYNSSTGVITVNQGELKRMQFDTDELAATIGHEIGHHLILKRDPGLWNRCLRDKPKANHECELVSDIIGQVLMYKAGYDMCKADDYWLRILEWQGDIGGDTHPKTSTRAKALNCEKGPAKEYIDLYKIKKGKLNNED